MVLVLFLSRVLPLLSVRPGIRRLLLLLLLLMLLSWWGISPARRRSRCVPWRSGLPAAHQLLLSLIARLLGRIGRIPGRHEGMFNGTNLFKREHGLC